MRRTERTQHTPGRGASHSRGGGLRWRKPRARQPWTRPLRRTKRSLGSTLTRIDASARVIDAAERFAPSRPIAATRQLLLVALWLSEAATHLGRATRGLQETTESIAVALAPFGQVDVSLARKYEGTGLGLALAKRIIELHGGRLEIESALGLGTTVRMYLPR